MHENDSLILSLRYIGISGDYMVSRDTKRRIIYHGIAAVEI
jgi:hypothetical protein